MILTSGGSRFFELNSGAFFGSGVTVCVGFLGSSFFPPGFLTSSTTETGLNFALKRSALDIANPIPPGGFDFFVSPMKK